jgi:hypothetical protein
MRTYRRTDMTELIVAFYNLQMRLNMLCVCVCVCVRVYVCACTHEVLYLKSVWEDEGTAPHSLVFALGGN